LKYRDERCENLWFPKLMFATNNRMRYRDQSGALTRRLVVIECPNSLPDHRLDGSLIQKFVPELGTFAAACIALATEAQDHRVYPESEAMRNLLVDIETNGDAVKLWLAENFVFDPKAFETTQALYSDFRCWCTENGLFPVSRPKLRDTLMGVRSGVISTKRRILDNDTGDIKPLWGLAGIRLRREDDPDDDLDDGRSTVPESFHEEIRQESFDDAICSGVPTESKTSVTIAIESIPITVVKVEVDQRETWNTGTIPDTAPQPPMICDGTPSEVSGVHGQSQWVSAPATPSPDSVGRNDKSLIHGVAVGNGVNPSSNSGDVRNANGG
jgi:hypothetical protein